MRVQSNALIYSIEDVPKWYLCLLFGFQHYLTMLSGSIAYPLMLAPALCLGENSPNRGHLISTTFFVTGISTFLQATLGSRLPIIQGNSFAYLLPTLAILNLPQWKCPDHSIMRSSSVNQTNYAIENTNEVSQSTQHADDDEMWQIRMREVQGAIICASLVEIFLGLTGLVGYLMKFVSPVTIAPVIGLIGLSFYKQAAKTASANWPISIGTMALLVILSQYCDTIEVPIFIYSKRKGWYKKRVPIFKLLPVLITISVSWFLCLILTETGALGEGDKARTDLRYDVVNNSPWIRMAYPGQWGSPTFSVGAICGMLCGVLSSIIESVGDYYACAKLSGAPPPPTHAINRGITMEGIGCLLAGLFGTGSALTSYSSNIGAIGVTKVGSRRVVQWAALLLVVVSIFSKIGSLFIIMPDPVLGGIFPFVFAVITGVGLSSLHYIDLNSSRNVFIVGVSLFLGLMIPNWIEDHPTAINIGNEFADQLITVLLSTGVFVAGVVGIFLDNTMRGTDEERGILLWKEDVSTVADREPIDSGEDEESPEITRNRILDNCYNLPIGEKFFKKHNIMKRVPISPTYRLH